MLISLCVIFKYRHDIILNNNQLTGFGIGVCGVLYKILNMKPFTELEEYIRFIEKGEIQVWCVDEDRICFNGFENSILYLKDLLVPEISLCKKIRTIYSDSKCCINHQTLIPSLESLNKLFYIHPSTFLTMRHGLHISCRGEAVDYLVLTPRTHEYIAEFVAEQKNSLSRVCHCYCRYVLKNAAN